MKVKISNLETRGDSVVVHVEFIKDGGEVITKKYSFMHEDSLTLMELKQTLKNERDRIIGIEEKMDTLESYVGKELEL